MWNDGYRTVCDGIVMTDEITEIASKLKITNAQGLHMRAVKLLVEESQKFSSRITLARNGEVVDAKSTLDVMTLGATCGIELALRAQGPDAEEAVRSLKELAAKKFFEDEYGD